MLVLFQIQVLQKILHDILVSLQKVKEIKVMQILKISNSLIERTMLLF